MPPVEAVDCVVVGAGVIGIAVARALALRGRQVLVCERDGGVARGTTSRNSEVIHAGIYYPKGSLKSRLCVEGKKALYRFCEERSVAYRRCGKLIVATSESQREQLLRILSSANANGVTDLRWVDQSEAEELEPDILCTSALLSPSTGIVDSHGLVLALQGEAEALGTEVCFNTTVTGASVMSPEGSGQGSLVVHTPGLDLRCHSLVNCAGLAAGELAGQMVGLPTGSHPRIRFAKGNYFRYNGKAPFRRLVYPVPQEAGLGVHATVDLAGQVRFGPDVEWIDPPNPWPWSTGMVGGMSGGGRGGGRDRDGAGARG